MVRGGFHGAWGLAGLQLWQDGWRDRLWRVGMELGHRAALSVHDPFLYSLGVRVTVLIRKGGWQVGWACAEAGLLGRHSPKGRPDAIASPGRRVGGGLAGLEDCLVASPLRGIGCIASATRRGRAISRYEVPLATSLGVGGTGGLTWGPQAGAIIGPVEALCGGAGDRTDTTLGVGLCGVHGGRLLPARGLGRKMHGGEPDCLEHRVRAGGVVFQHALAYAESLGRLGERPAHFLQPRGEVGGRHPRCGGRWWMRFVPKALRAEGEASARPDDLPAIVLGLCGTEDRGSAGRRPSPAWP